MRRPETDWEQIHTARVRVGWSSRRPAEVIEQETDDEYVQQRRNASRISTRNRRK